MKNNIFYQSAIKKDIIDLLMFSLYPDARTIYREYIQNALDSINSAVKQGILSQAKDGVVNITINSKEKSISIRDNGTGIDIEKAPARILDISASPKDGISAAGKFGIGRLVGGGYCHKLIFTTTSKGENVATQVIFNVDEIWKMVKQTSIEYLATEVIDSCTEIIHIPEEKEAHYFEVQLHEVKTESSAVLLDKDSVVDYLNSVAPVDYKSEFKNTLIYKSTKAQPEFKGFHDELEKVQVFVESKRLEKQYGLNVNGSGDKIYNLEYFKIEDERYGMLGWGWFALTKYTIQIGRDDNLSGIRLRKHNIQIGDFDILSGKPLWKEERGNSYFYGEFFVTNSNIVPTAARDGLAPTVEKQALYAALTEYFKKLHDVYTKANAAKKAIEKINEGILKTNQNSGLDRISKDLIDNKGIATFEKLLKNASFKPQIHMLELYRDEYEKAKKNAMDIEVAFKEHKNSIINTKLDNLESNISNKNEDHNKSKQELKTENRDIFFNENDLNKNAKNNTNASKQIIEISKPIDDKKFIQTNDTDFIPNILMRKDLLIQLNGVLDDNEIWMLRRVFRVLNTFCPNNERDQKLIESIEELIVKEFKND